MLFQGRKIHYKQMLIWDPRFNIFLVNHSTSTTKTSLEIFPVDMHRVSSFKRCTLHFLSATHITLHWNGTWKVWHLLRPPAILKVVLPDCISVRVSSVKPHRKGKETILSRSNLCWPRLNGPKMTGIIQVIADNVRNENY